MYGTTFGWATFPTTNNNNQVSQCLCGVLMDTPIQPLTVTMIDRSWTWCSANTVSHFDMVDQYGTIDPMSRPERLPPCLAAFYKTDADSPIQWNSYR